MLIDQLTRIGGKRLLALLLAVWLTAVQFSAAAFAAAASDEEGSAQLSVQSVQWEGVSGIFEYSIDDGEAWIVECDSSASGAITIPFTLEGCPVTGIASWAFEDCSGITSVSIPSSVTDLGYAAFSGCTGLQSVIIPNSVTQIGMYAFENCVKLTGVTIPGSVGTIREGVFGGCTGLKNATISNGVKCIDQAFYGCTGLTSITIPSSVTYVDNWAFSGCTGLTSFSVASGNQNYSSDSYGVLYNKNKTELITYPAGNTRTGFTIPNSVTEIGSGAFYKCVGLTSITIPNSVTEIGSYAFENCIGLTGITIPNSVTNLNYAAFEGCVGLTSVTIPSSVADMSEPFRGCTGITSIAVSSSNKCFSSDSYGVVYNKDKTTLIQYPLGNTRANFTIPSSVNRIDYAAFTGCTHLNEVIVPNSVTEIGGSAFENCENLSTVLIGNHVEIIEYYAFSGCKSLNYVTIPDSVTEIDSGAFKDCESLSAMVIGSRVETIGYYAFSGCKSLVNVTIPDCVQEINQYAFDNCTGLVSISLSNGLDEIEIRVFNNCTSLKTVKIGKNTKSIQGYAFAGCTALTEFTVDVGNAYFSTDSNGILYNKDKTVLIRYPAGKTQTEFTVPSTVKKIDDCAFRDNQSIKKLTIANGTQTIEWGAFENSKALQQVKIPNTVTQICYYNFINCDALKHVELPDSLTEIESRMFCDCAVLEYVHIPSSVNSISIWDVFDNTTAYICSDTAKCYAKTYAEENDIEFRLCSGHAQAVTLTGIAVKTMPTKTTYTVGDSFDSSGLTLTATYSDGSTSTITSGFTCSGFSSSTTGTKTITVSYEGKTTTFTVLVTAAPVTLSRIAVKTMPNKTVYTVGESFDQSGLTLTATYSDGSTNTISSGFTCSGFSSSTTGTKTITVSYEGKTTTFTVTVNAPAALTGIAVKTTPNKTSYTVGETLNTAGLTLTAQYSDGSSKTVTSGFTCSPTKLNTAGQQTITVTYSGKTAAFVVTVKSTEPTQGRVRAVDVKNMAVNYKATGAVTPTVTADAGVKYTVSYSSSNTKVATVNDNGVVMGVKKGAAKITCTVTDEYGNSVSDTCTVTVKYTVWQWIIIILLFGWIWY